MGNQNVVTNKTEQVNAEQQVQQQVVPAQQVDPATMQQQVIMVPVQQRNGFLAWCKRHWKMLVAGAAGTGAVVGSAFVAYRKGKQNGMNCVPAPEVEEPDYSLDPNRE